MATITFSKTSMFVTLDDGRVASRKTKNNYKSVVVGMVGGKLKVLSAHWTESSAAVTIQSYNAGNFINHNFHKGVSDIQAVVHADPIVEEIGNFEFEPVSPEEQERIIAAECKAIREGKKVR